MFEFFFKYPWTMYRKGELVFLRGWPWWVFAVLGVAVAVAVVVLMIRKRPEWMTSTRALTLGGLQAVMVSALLLLFWQPALSVATLRPQQNVVALVVDRSRSMSERWSVARQVAESRLVPELQKKYPVRMYTMSGGLAKVETLEGVKPDGATTRFGEALRAAAGESATLPVGAIVLLSDGADNSGGVDRETIAALKRVRIPVHTIGFGEETLRNDAELTGVQLPARALPNAKLTAFVGIRQGGFPGTEANIVVRDGQKVLATRRIKLPEDGKALVEPVSFTAGEAGPRLYSFALDTLPGEKNAANNARTQLVQVDNKKPRILYIEGEPRWEQKFIRRALEADKQLELVTLLRTTQNKFYRQGIGSPKELEDGFPASVEELFGYDALIVGCVEAAYFTAAQQTLIKEFADRRGGGVLFLGGRSALSDGGWGKSPAAEMLPVALTDRKGTYHRFPAGVELTNAGAESLLTRLDETAEKSAARWKRMPGVGDYQDTGAPKAGAAVLLNAVAAGRRVPLLTTQQYGRGKVAVLATGATWKWQMLLDSKDTSHETFWQQLARWLVMDSRGRVVSSMPKSLLADEEEVRMTAEVRDANFLPAADASVEARISGPDGMAEQVVLQADPKRPGLYSASWKAVPVGAYVAEVVAKRGDEETGRDTLVFQRQDGTQEAFHPEQNRELLERISSETGGRYYTPERASELTKEIEFSDAGISVTETHDLWNVPAALLAVFALKAAEWLLRRKWGAV